MNTIKNHLSTFLFFPLFFFTLIAPAYADYRSIVPFPDIQDHIFEYEIGMLYKLGYIDGYTDGLFRPENTITRGEFSKIIVNVFSLPESTSQPQFPDISTDHIFFTYIQQLADAGVVDGYSDGLFKAEEPVSRGEALKMIVNATRYFDSTVLPDVAGCTDFSDISSTPFIPYICAITEYNLPDGFLSPFSYENELLLPDANATRAEITQWTFALGALIPKTTDSLPHISVDGWDGNFALPSNNKSFEAPVVVTDAVLTRWKRENEYADGYIIEWKVPKSIEWERLEQDVGLFPTAKKNLLSVFGDIEPTDEYTVLVSGQEFTYTVLSGDTRDDVITALTNLVNTSGIVSTSSEPEDIHSFYATSRIPGYKYGIATLTTDNGGSGQIFDLNVDTPNDEGEAIEYGLVPAEEHELYNTPHFDRKDKTKYQYRLASYTFLPYQIVDTDYENQEDLEEDLPTTTNAIISPWSYSEVVETIDNELFFN
ncbi:S-layer homology domain-containing protein [Candidatus Dojkabacteria bacterium]|uniref:S-layer homology domain-containing protein n=1 Tax=Candidatus Dojkabacteria bacterium TaxID=2099670 RepID=A0A955L7N6_9BACT|nr:S-layer homology domain-containing protein [Candidatus Dojkabacteria bacterium]